MKYGIIFDLDGTLVDSLPSIARSLNRALAQHSLSTHTTSAVRGFIGAGARMLVHRASPADSSAELRGKIEAAFQADYEISWPAGTSPYPGIVELLERLQAEKFPLAVLSNKPHPFTTVIVAKLFPQIHFKAVIGQLPGIPHKPAPNAALEIAGIFNLTPQQCLLIGDSTIDLETAKNAAMPAISVAWGYHDAGCLRSAGAVELVAHSSELLDRLLAMSIAHGM